MIYKLTKQKEKIINNYFKNFSEFINTENKQIDSTLIDKNTNLQINISFLNKLKTLVTFDREEISKLSAKDKLVALDSLLKSKRENINILREELDESHTMLLNNIDKQIQYDFEELQRINNDLRTVKNPITNVWKGWKKKKIEDRNATIPKKKKKIEDRNATIPKKKKKIEDRNSRIE